MYPKVKKETTIFFPIGERERERERELTKMLYLEEKK